MITHSKMVQNILAVYNEATLYELKAGSEWYGEAWEFCRNLGWRMAAHNQDIPHEISTHMWSRVAAAIVAVLSPQKEWELNKAFAAAAVEALMRGEPVKGHYVQQCEKVHKLYDAAHNGTFNDRCLGIISKPDSQKTRCFFLNICGSTEHVTIDGHAVNAAHYGLERHSILKAKCLSGAAYADVASAYEDAASTLGIKPPDLQAIVWLTYRRLVPVKGGK